MHDLNQRSPPMPRRALDLSTAAPAAPLSAPAAVPNGLPNSLANGIPAVSRAGKRKREAVAPADEAPAGKRQHAAPNAAAANGRRPNQAGGLALLLL